MAKWTALAVALLAVSCAQQSSGPPPVPIPQPWPQPPPSRVALGSHRHGGHGGALPSPDSTGGTQELTARPPPPPPPASGAPQHKTFKGETGHRTDPDSGDGKVDGYLRIDAVREDGSWSGFQHTSPTGWLGGCSRGSVVFYDDDGNYILAKDLGVWCVNGRNQPSSDNQGPLNGPPGDIPPDVIAAAAKMAVVGSPGEKDMGYVWDKIIEIGVQIAIAYISG